MDRPLIRQIGTSCFLRSAVLRVALGLALFIACWARPALAVFVDQQCDNGICIKARCPSNPVEVWINLEKDVIDVTIHKDEVTHYNARSWCFKETQREVKPAMGSFKMPPNCNFSLQACEPGLRVLFLPRTSQCSPWASFKGVSCPDWTAWVENAGSQQPPAAPPDPAGACGPGKYGTEGCPYPSFGGSKEQSEFVVFCQDYAGRAVAAVAESTQLGCGKSGDRWIPDYLPHANWCISLNGDRTLPNSETAARSQELYECRSQVLLPGQSGGVGALKHLKGLQGTTAPAPMPIPQDTGDKLLLKRGGKDALAALLPGASAPAAPEPVAPAAPQVCPKTFAGAWSTVTQPGAAFRLDLQQQGKRVAGSFTHENPVYNGALQGRRKGNQLAFTTAQPNYGAGTGEFALSASGCEISGRFWMNDSPGQVYSWTGTRLQ
jgi:hypothetical protein